MLKNKDRFKITDTVEIEKACKTFYNKIFKLSVKLIFNLFKCWKKCHQFNTVKVKILTNF